MTLREVVEKGLGDDWPSDANARADLLNRARNAAGYDTTLPVMKAILAEEGQTAGHRAGGTARTLQVALSTAQADVLSRHARRPALAGWTPLQPGRPLELAFTEGRLDLAAMALSRSSRRLDNPRGRLLRAAPARPAPGRLRSAARRSRQSPGKAGRLSPGRCFSRPPPSP